MNKRINISSVLKRSRFFIFAIMIYLICAISPNHSSASQYAFIWDSVNGMQELSTPGQSSYASGINNSGQVVGMAEGLPFIWDNVNGMQDLEALVGKPISPNSINDLGQILGYSDNHAVVWDSVNGVQTLGQIDDHRLVIYNSYTDINNSGQILGFTDVPAGPTLSWIKDLNGGYQILEAFGFHTFAYGINDSGQIVGNYEAWHIVKSEAFIWDSVNGMQDLGSLFGIDNYYFSAHDINNSGQIVGTYVVKGEYNNRYGFIWDSINGLQDLGLGINPKDINDSGQVVGFVAPVPIPGSVWLFATALTGLFGIRRKFNN